MISFQKKQKKTSSKHACGLIMAEKTEDTQHIQASYGS